MGLAGCGCEKMIPRTPTTPPREEPRGGRTPPPPPPPKPREPEEEEEPETIAPRRGKDRAKEEEKTGRSRRRGRRSLATSTQARSHGATQQLDQPRSHSWGTTSYRPTRWTLDANRGKEFALRKLRNDLIKRQLEKGLTMAYRSSGWSCYPAISSNGLCYWEVLRGK